MYWVESLNHNNFNYATQQTREKFTQCLEANCKQFENMRILKLRDSWDKTDDNLVYNDKFTKAGLSAYWHSLDASFQFNVKKRIAFLIRSRFRAQKFAGGNSKIKEKDRPKRAILEDSGGEDETSDADMNKFFKLHRKQGLTPNNDRFHWNRSGANGNRFMLPRLKFY